MRAVDVFCAVFGAIAGDLVLTLGAWDGVFLSAGWCRNCCRRCNAPASASGSSTRALLPAMARVPTLAVVHPQPGLLGCAVIAVAEAAGTPV